MPDRSTQSTGGNTPPSNDTTSLDAADDCPDCTPVELTYRTRLGRKRLAEHARREIVLGSIRAHLNEQPTPRAVRAASRRWCAAIRQAAEQIARGDAA